MLTNGGYRTAIPEDFRGEQNAVLETIAPTIRNSPLRARVADVVWLNNRRARHSAELAVDAYCECVTGLLSGSLKRQFESSRKIPFETLGYLRRALQIAYAITRGGILPPQVVSALADFRDAAREANDLGLIRQGAELALRYGTEDPADLAAEAERVARIDSPEIDRFDVKSLLDLAASAHGQAGDRSAQARCRLEAAEQLVIQAERMSGSAMTRSALLMDAIQAMRSLPGTKERRKQLETQLRGQQADVLDELGPISSGPIDLSELARGTVEAIEGHPLPAVLARLANLTRSTPVEELKGEARQAAEQAPLVAFMGGTQLDAQGKVVGSIPPLLPGAEPSWDWYKHQISRLESLKRGIFVKGQFEPVRRHLMQNFPLSQLHFGPITRSSPFVPAGYEDVFALGFARLMQGECISAAHLLLPQMENSVRYVLRQAGGDPSIIQANMLQEDRSLSAMLDQQRAELERVFGEALVLEIELLFTDGSGPALRHTMAHGKLSADHCYGADVIYACWMVYRLCCLPLLPHWGEIANSIEEQAF